MTWALDSPPAPLDSGPAAIQGDRIWAELSAGLWLQAAHHFIWVYGSGAPIQTDQMESGERVRFSPDRSLAVVLATSASHDVPVLESATGTIKFRLPLARSEAIVFSPDGDTIFASGRATFGAGEPERLLAVSASGHVAIDTPLTGPMLWDLVLDTGGPWLYGVAITDDGALSRPIIHVFDRRTLGHIASLRPPTAVLCYRIPFCGQVGMAISTSDRKLYVLEIAGWGTNPVTTPSGIYAFDLLPTNQTSQILSP